VRAVLVLLIWGAAVLVALVILAVLGYELVGHVRRLLRTVTAARDEVLPALRRLRLCWPARSRYDARARELAPGALARQTTGRHRAGVPRP
jgi:hypothetical protein